MKNKEKEIRKFEEKILGLVQENVKLKTITRVSPVPMLPLSSTKLETSSNFTQSATDRCSKTSQGGGKGRNTLKRMSLNRKNSSQLQSIVQSLQRKTSSNTVSMIGGVDTSTPNAQNSSKIIGPPSSSRIEENQRKQPKDKNNARDFHGQGNWNEESFLKSLISKKKDLALQKTKGNSQIKQHEATM